MSNYGVVSRLVRVLEHAREEPRVFCSSVDTADSFLRGVQITMSLCLENDQDFKIRRQIVRERGWIGSSVLPWEEMQQAGKAETDIIKEMFTIEFLVWQQVARALKNDQRA